MFSVGTQNDVRTHNFNQMTFGFAPHTQKATQIFKFISRYKHMQLQTY